MGKSGKDFIEAFNKTFNYEKLTGYIFLFIKIVAILLITKIIIRVLSLFIERFFNKQKNSKFGMNGRKADTLCELLKSIVRYVMYFISIMWVFEIIGLDIKTLIAVTSVAGVAIGFGAQNLVKDVITGFFILFEDQFAVGDYVILDGMSGIVEALGLRITKIRDVTGDLHIIPNGSIGKVTNKSRGNMRAMVEVDISYEANVEYAMDTIRKVCIELKKEMPEIVEGPEVLGITNFKDSGVTIRIIAKSVPMKQWDVEMELRKRIKKELDKNQIEIAYPTRVIVNKGKTN